MHAKRCLGRTDVKPRLAEVEGDQRSPGARDLHRRGHPYGDRGDDRGAQRELQPSWSRRELGLEEAEQR